jgi:hypothetical protein
MIQFVLAYFLVNSGRCDVYSIRVVSQLTVSSLVILAIYTMASMVRHSAGDLGPCYLQKKRPIGPDRLGKQCNCE